MSIGEGVLKEKGRHRLPLTVRPLDIAGAGLIAAGFAHIMEQRGDSDTLRTGLQTIELPNPLPLQIGRQAVVDVHAMVAQSPGIGPMVPGRGRSRKKVALVLQIVQKRVRALPVDIFLINLDKFFLPNNFPMHHA